MRYVILRVIFLLMLVLCMTAAISAQSSSLWIPPKYQQVYEDSLHMYDGTPGPNYWQNHAKYDIHVDVDPATRMLSGQATITYYNESPDTLQELVLRLHQDIYKRGSPRTFPMPDSSLHDGVVLSNIQVNGTVVSIDDAESFQRDGTLAILSLPDSLLPKSSLDISLRWETKMPVHGLRTGFVDSTSAFIGYWYPQVAVYDAISGWDQHAYLGQWEFYQDYADFQVEITLPDSFLVWGTGALQNPDDLLRPKYLRRYQRAQESSQVIEIVEAPDIASGQILRKKGIHTWIFQANQVPDFAFALSDYYHWEGVRVTSGTEDKSVFLQTAYADDTRFFEDTIRKSRFAIAHATSQYPVISFPFLTLTLFDAQTSQYAGMEFPMMIHLGGTQADSTFHTMITLHEVIHMYVPFHVAINETQYAWMDEGFAEYLAYEMLPLYLKPSVEQNRSVSTLQAYYSRHYDVPTITSSDQIIDWVYFANSYILPASAFVALADLLGKVPLQKALQAFFRRWAGKHPLPWDFFFTFNDVLEEDLSWFWQPWFYEAHIPDIGITAVEKAGANYWITLENPGGLPSPVDLTVTYADSTTEDIHHTARIWEHGKCTYRFPVESAQNILSVELVEKMTVDMDATNNQFIMNTR